MTVSAIFPAPVRFYSVAIIRYPMKNSARLVPSMLFLLCLCTTSCKDETEITPHDLLIGQWNVYESGDHQNGFAVGVTSGLTLLYESGIHFKHDGTFTPRYYFNEAWSEWDTPAGNFELLNAQTMRLTFYPGTPDESVLNLHLIKLTSTEFWFTHDHFPMGTEMHLRKDL